MDGPLIATVVSSSVVIGGAIAGGFWRVLVKIGDQNKAIGGQSEAIGEVKGELKGIGKWMESCDKRFGTVEEGFRQLHSRVNNVVNAKPKRAKRKTSE